MTRQVPPHEGGPGWWVEPSPLRTRERAAVEVARKYLRGIIERCDEDRNGVIRGLAAGALYEIAQALGDRS